MFLAREQCQTTLFAFLLHNAHKIKDYSTEIKTSYSSLYQLPNMKTTLNLIYILAISSAATAQDGAAPNKSSNLRGAPPVLESDAEQSNLFEIVFAEEESQTQCVPYGGRCRTSFDCCSIFGCSSITPGGTRFCAF